MKQTILFLCPHNAAKSVIAAAYFRFSLKLSDATTKSGEPDDKDEVG